MALFGIDIAWDRPTIAAIKATGAHWVARYFSPDTSKNLTASEVHDYPAAGLAIVTVFESTAGRATQGYAAGVADARLAEQQRIAVGLPAGHIHHFAVDEDTSWASVQPYFDGAASVIGLARTGAYGGLAVIEGAYAHGLRFLWQTVAWSGGVWSSHATIRQTGGTELAGGADDDYAEATDFGQYPSPLEPDMPLNQADADLVAKTLLAAGIPNQFRLDANGRPALTSVSTFLAFGDHHFDVLSQQNTALVAQVTALQKADAAQGAAIQALVTQLGAQHAGVDTAAVVAAVQAAIAAAVVHVDVAVTTPPTK